MVDGLVCLFFVVFFPFMGDGMVQKNLFFHEGWVDGGGCIDCKRYWSFAGVGMVGGGSWAV